MTDINIILIGEHRGLVHRILRQCDKWGDSREFIKDKADKADIICVAVRNDKIPGFCLAKNISTGSELIIAFFATRVLPDYRMMGISKKLIGRAMREFIVRNKVLKIANWFKPVYFVTATASPLVYEQITKYKKKEVVKADETRIAEMFVKAFSEGASFDKDTNIIKGGFSGSTECYYSEKDVPLAGDENINSMFKNVLQVATGNGNGLVVVSRIM